MATVFVVIAFISQDFDLHPRLTRRLHGKVPHDFFNTPLSLCVGQLNLQLPAVTGSIFTANAEGKCNTCQYVVSDIIIFHMNSKDKPLAWLHSEVKTPPFSVEARMEAGFLLRQLKAGEKLGLPHSRPMPAIGRRCHELRIVDSDVTWRIV
jgi:hypothetical protein